MMVIAASHLTKSFAGARPRRVLDDVSFDVPRGELVALVGESGVGKSTLLNVIAGLERADSGTLVVDGVDLSRLDDDALTRFRRERIGFVFQSFHILPYLSVGQNVALPLALNGRNDAASDARTRAMLAAVRLAERHASMPRELSGGELQRVAIARALVHAPRLVLADEPTGNLDPASAAQVMALFHACVKANGATALVATHSRTAAAGADRVLTLTASGVHAGLDADPAPAREAPRA